jgi:type IV pilus assembly protein PilE
MNGRPAATSGNATVAARCRIGFMTSFTALRHDARGFTLIELLIAVVVVGILAAVAYPSFMDSIRKGRRSDAFQALNAVQQAQERYRSDNAQYASTLAALPGSPSATSPNGYYTVALSGASATGYTLTASAVAGKSQASDGDCAQLRVRVAGGNLFYSSDTVGGSTFTEGASNRCWAR